MSIRLSVKERSEEGASSQVTEHVLDEPEISLGRDKACQVVLARQAVSRNHARITRDGELCFIEDLGSSFGTQVNGKPLPRGEKRLLKNGDTIGIAQFDVVFELAPALPQLQAEEKTAFVARQLVRDAMRGITSQEGPYLRFMNGAREGERVPIADAQELFIGREEGCTIRLQDDLVSRRHVKLRRDWAGVHVEDLDSRNGIKVNKRKVNRRTLKDKDELEVGSTRLLFIDPGQVTDAPPVELPEVAPAPPPPPRRAPTPPPPPPEPPAPALQQAPPPEAPAAEPPEEAPAGLEEESAPPEDALPPHLPPEPEVAVAPGRLRRVGAPPQMALLAGLGVLGLVALGLLLAVLMGL